MISVLLIETRITYRLSSNSLSPNSYMDLTKYMVKGLKYPDGEYQLARSVEVIDEGSFYRIDGTHIIDKHKIISIIEDSGRVEVKMKDKDIVLVI